MEHPIMKALIFAAMGSTLLCVAGFAYSQTDDQTPPAQQPMAQQMSPDTMPGATQPDTSMGGMRMGTSDSGRSARTGAPCVVGLSCDIYQGN
jgi:hypothetical protein